MRRNTPNNSNYSTIWEKKRESIFEQGCIDFIASLPETDGSLSQAIILSIAQQMERYYDKPIHTLCAEIKKLAKAKCPRMKERMIERALYNTPYIDPSKQTGGRKGAARTNAKRAANKLASVTSGVVTSFAANLSAKTSSVYSCEAISGNVHIGIGGYCPTYEDHIARLTSEHLSTITSDRFDDVRALISESGATNISNTMDAEGYAVDIFNSNGTYASPRSGTIYTSA